MPYPDIPKLGDCSASEQKYLQDKVNRAKKEVGKSGKCTGHDCCYILKMKKKAWLMLASIHWMGYNETIKSMETGIIIE